MEKEHQPESLATVTIKPDYPPSEVYSSEPPPAYHRHPGSAVQVAKIVAVTVVLVSLVLGGFLLASAYVTAHASCRDLEQELELLQAAADRFQAPLQPEALIQEEPIATKRQINEDKSADKSVDSNSIDDNSDSNSESSSSSSESSSNDEEDEERTPIHFKLPLQLDFDDIAGALIEKNQKSRMNCVVEKKRAEEVVDHQPKTVRLPFGVNLTTDPRYERLSGERMAIFCESGNMQRSQAQDEDEDDEEGDTVMIQPVMIPIPAGHFPTHMPQQMPPQMQHQIHRMQPMPPHMMINHQVPQQQQQQQQEFPPNPILQHIAQQIIAQKIMESQKAQQEENNQSEQVDQKIPLPEEILTQLNRLPNRDVIVAVQEQDPEGQQEMRVVQQQRTSPSEMNGRQIYARGLVMPVPMMPQPPQEQQAAPSEEMRPHYVQPRSVRSVDALLPKSQKRVKRCSCNCAC